MEGQVPQEVVKDRFDRLLKEVQAIAGKECARFESTVRTALVEEVNDQDPSLVTGRLDNNLLVHFPGTKEMIGALVPVRLGLVKDFIISEKQEK